MGMQRLMRSREEIQRDVAESNAENNGTDTVALLQLEVLLDMRELLDGLSHHMVMVRTDVSKIEDRIPLR